MNIDTTTFDKAAKYAVGTGYGPVVSGGPAKRVSGEILSIVIHTTNNAKVTTFSGEAGFLYTSPNVSAHFLNGKEGQVVQFLDPKWIAWHTGAVNDRDCGNMHAIGIENHFCMPDLGWPRAMRDSLTELCIMLLKQYPSIKKIVTHRSVAVPRGRKIDPSGWNDADFVDWRTRVFVLAGR